MKKTLALLAILAIALQAGASPCGFTGYGAGYGASYGYSATYYPGSYHWGGGWYAGCDNYPQGYYQKGFYAYPVKTIIQPTILKYVAVAPLVELASYGAYYTQSPPAGVASAPAAASPGHAPVASAATSSLEAKMDRLLALGENTAREVNMLKVRVEALERGGRPGSPTPSVDPTPTPPAASPEKPDVPTVMFNKCASCHEAKTAAKLGKNLVLFVASDTGAEMATFGPGGKPTPLSVITIRKIVRVLKEDTMPPKETDGKPTPADKLLTPDQRKEAIAFFESAIASGPK